MRVLQVSDSFLPTLGGMENHVQVLSRFLVRQGHDVTILTKFNSRLETREEFIDGIQVIRKLKLKEITNNYEYYKQNLSLRNNLIRYSKNFDLIHYHGKNLPAFLNLDKRIKQPLVITVHGYFPVCIYYLLLNWANKRCLHPASISHCLRCYGRVHPNRHKLRFLFTWPIKVEHIMRKKALTAFRRVICVSDYMKNVLAVTGHKNLVTIPNFVDLNNEILPTIKMGRQINVKDYYDIPPQNKVILYAGRLSVEKGVGNLLWAFKHINHVLKNVYLMIIGDGPQMDILKMEINKNIETHTIFAGRVSREFVLQAIRQSDVFVLPSIWPDPCPTSVIEAMTLGKPIIGTEGGGASELVINNWNGFLVQPGNIEELATKIIQILTHDDLLEVFGKNSRLNSTQYDIQAVGPRIIQIYRDLMKDK